MANLNEWHDTKLFDLADKLRLPDEKKFFFVPGNLCNPEFYAEINAALEKRHLSNFPNVGHV